MNDLVPSMAALPVDAGVLMRHVEQFAWVGQLATQLVSSSVEAGRVDAALMAVSRALMPIDYTTGDGFGHDPALGQSPVPAPDPIRHLAAASGPDDAAFRLVAATRARNRIAHALDEAATALRAGLA